MAIELVMPKLGLTMREGMITRWLRNEGELLKKGDELLEIQTEKLTNVIESPADGRLLKILGRPGDSLPIAAVLAYIGEDGETLPAATSEPAASGGDWASKTPCAAISAPPKKTDGVRVKASPAARALAKKTGVDYTLLTGTGPGGRIVKADVAAAAALSEAPSAARSVSAPRVPYAGMRKAIGAAMSSSWSAAPMVTHHVRADVTELLAFRSRLNEGVEDHSLRIGVLDIFVKIVAKAILEFPIMGASLSGDEIIMPDSINIGVAVALDGGLVVPVARDAARKDIFTLSAEIKTLITKARSNALALDDVKGGNFTISNIGGYESVDFFTPIINQPESAILGLCRTLETPVVKNGEIVIRSLAGLSLTFDHRVIDGAPAAEFLALLLKYSENPLRAVFE